MVSFIAKISRIWEGTGKERGLNKERNVFNRSDKPGSGHCSRFLVADDP